MIIGLYIIAALLYELFSQCKNSEKAIYCLKHSNDINPANPELITIIRMPIL
jgi:hypothetical protein